MNEFPELIGQYVERPERGHWECLACSATARKLGYSGGSASQILDREQHTAWHNRHLPSRRP
jgi:hypothetical protein